MGAEGKNSALLVTSGIAAGLAIGHLYNKFCKYQARKSAVLFKGDGKVKFEYFPIAGAGEKVRLALAVTGVPFDDVAVAGDAWRKEGTGRKFAAKYGQMPILTFPNGEELYQSYAMLRYIGSMDPKDKLYPADPEKRLQVEVALGVVSDFNRRFIFPLCMGVCPDKLGHPADMDKDTKTALIKKLREDFLKEELPKYMKYLLDLIQENGGKYLCGQDLTIADLDALHTVKYFSKGIADFIPKDTLDKYPGILNWIDDVMEYPSIKEYYAQQQK